MTAPRPPGADALRLAADRATRAPSPDNSQPWTLQLHRDRLELLLDRDRRSERRDPAGREVVLSVGAALLNARVAVAGSGLVDDVRRFPDPARPELAAELRARAGTPDPALAALAPAVDLRHSNRRPYLDAPPDDVVTGLVAAAAAEGVVLVVVRGEEQRAVVDRATRYADAVLAGALPRDLYAAAPRPRPAPEAAAAGARWLVLATSEDTPPQWLRAGEALERVLLEVVRHGYQASPFSRPTEVPVARAELAELTGALWPQVLVRVGRAEPVGPAPRRRTVDVLHDRTSFPAPG